MVWDEPGLNWSSISLTPDTVAQLALSFWVDGVAVSSTLACCRHRRDIRHRPIDVKSMIFENPRGHRRHNHSGAGRPC